MLNAQQCYRALKSRDHRFDGRFFTAVLTTGIYCRPICPAPIPKFENTRFYPCAAAAEEAGFRPCLRCRPETSPGTPAWQGTSATVSRALRLISDGLLDEGGVDDLSMRLGVGSRHLRRLFREHLGASPLAVAQTRRVHFAKNLIDETNLPITEIALSAGFSSVRRFNAAFREAFQQSPSQVRRKKTVTAPSNGNLLHLKLRYREPFDWASLIGFLGVRAIPGVESVQEGVYRRTIRFGKDNGIIEVRHQEAHLTLTVPAAFSRHASHIVARARRIFDLGADPKAIADRLDTDPILGKSCRANPGRRVPGAWDGFEIAVRGITGQQVSVKGATTVTGQIVEAYGEPLEGYSQYGLTHIFPASERLAAARMNRIGMPRKRALTIRALARAVVDGHVDFRTAKGLEETVGQLCELPGIGPWTAQYIAMRAFGEPDAFPAGDLGLRRAAARGTEKEASQATLTELAESWRPWRAYAAMHLWSSLSSGG